MILRSCSMKIFCTANISKLNFWLLICIAKNFIWTTLKIIFSIFRFFHTLRFSNIVQTIHQWKYNFFIFQMMRKSQFHKIDSYDWFCGCITYFKFWSYGPLLTVTDVCGTGAGPQARWSVSPSSRSSSSAARAAFRSLRRVLWPHGCWSLRSSPIRPSARPTSKPPLASWARPPARPRRHPPTARCPPAADRTGPRGGVSRASAPTASPAPSAAPQTGPRSSARCRPKPAPRRRRSEPAPSRAPRAASRRSSQVRSHSKLLLWHFIVITIQCVMIWA